MRTQKSAFTYRVIYGVLNDPDLLFRFLKKIESISVFGAVIPCKLLAGETHLAYLIYRTIKDFEKNGKKAKKINIQFLMRFSVEDQISKLMSKIKIEKKMPICLIFFFNTRKINNPIEKIYHSIIEQMLNNNIVSKLSDTPLCKPDINDIKKFYNISDSEIEAASRETDNLSILTRIIMEKIALVFLR